MTGNNAHGANPFLSRASEVGIGGILQLAHPMTESSELSHARQKASRLFLVPE